MTTQSTSLSLIPKQPSCSYSGKECSICLDNHLKNNYPGILPCKCKNYCEECLTDWIIALIQNTSFDFDGQYITCLNGYCQREYKLEKVKDEFNNFNSQRINDALFSKYCKSQKDIQKCPRIGCDYMGIGKKDCQGNFDCPNCAFSWRRQNIIQNNNNQLQVYNQNNDSMINFIFTYIVSLFSDVRGAPKKIWSSFIRWAYTEKCPKCKREVQKGNDSHIRCPNCNYYYCFYCKLHKYYEFHDIGCFFSRAYIVLKWTLIIGIILHFIGLLPYGLIVLKFLWEIIWNIIIKSILSIFWWLITKFFKLCVLLISEVCFICFELVKLIILEISPIIGLRLVEIIGEVLNSLFPGATTIVIEAFYYIMIQVYESQIVYGIIGTAQLFIMLLCLCSRRPRKNQRNIVQGYDRYRNNRRAY